VRNYLLAGVLTVCTGLIPSIACAQSANGNVSNTAANASTTETVTGCVAAGKKAGIYTLTGNDGTMYVLRGKDNFAEHVGHTVTVSGKVMTAASKNDRPNGTSPSNSADDPDSTAKTGTTNDQVGGSNSGAAGPVKTSTVSTAKPHLMVKSISMVSDSCQAK
jgi:hypothetical protein